MGSKGGVYDTFSFFIALTYRYFSVKKLEKLHALKRLSHFCLWQKIELSYLSGVRQMR